MLREHSYKSFKQAFYFGTYTKLGMLKDGNGEGSAYRRPFNYDK